MRGPAALLTAARVPRVQRWAGPPRQEQRQSQRQVPAPLEGTEHCPIPCSPPLIAHTRAQGGDHRRVTHGVNWVTGLAAAWSLTDRNPLEGGESHPRTATQQQDPGAMALPG